MPDHPNSPASPVTVAEYRSVYTYFNDAMGMEVPLYTFNPAAAGGASELDRADWMRMAEALDMIRAKAAFPEIPPEAKLISALKAAAVIAIHGRVTRTANGASAGFDRSYQYVYPRQWATCLGLNVDEDSISLSDGAPLVDIYLNRMDVAFWIEVRSNPASPLKSDPDYLRRCDQRIFELSDPDADFRFNAKPAPRRGGRPAEYNWEKAVIHLMVNAVYHGGRLTDVTSKAEIGRLLTASLNEIGDEAHPSASVVAEHASMIWEAFEAARQAHERRRA